MPRLVRRVQPGWEGASAVKKTPPDSAAECVICFEGTTTSSYACEACGKTVCGPCADRYLETAALAEETAPPSCPCCRSPSWCLALLEDRALRRNDTEASLACGVMYMDKSLATGEKAARRKAIDFLTVAAEADNKIAAHNLGTLLMASGGADLSRAEAYLVKAGLPVSTLNLAFVHRARGRPRKAVKALRRAALAGCGPAFFWLGIEYHDGSEVVRRDRKLGRRLVEIAAALGYLRAVRFLAHHVRDACKAAAFLHFIRDVLKADLAHRDHLLIHLHSLTCPTNTDPAHACPATYPSCLCHLIPRAFSFIRRHRHLLADGVSLDGFDAAAAPFPPPSQ